MYTDVRQRGDFSRIHPLPHSGQEVPDDLDARLVVLGIDHSYSKEDGSAAQVDAEAILEARGNSPRLYRNTLVFLAPDKTRLQDLNEATRKFLAWESILAEREALNLDPQQVKQAETQKAAADSAVTARLPETYQWLLLPEQRTPQAAVTWQALRLTGQDPLAVRASKKLRNEELLVTSFAASRLRIELDRVPLWRGDHVSVKQLAEDFARYLYLPRLKDSAVLLGAVREGVALLTWELDGFAFADSFDDAADRYRGLRVAQQISLADVDTPGMLVKPDIARQQLAAESAQSPAGSQVGGTAVGGEGSGSVGPINGRVETTEPAVSQPKRFHGAVHPRSHARGPRRQSHRRRGDCTSCRPNRSERQGDARSGG